MFKVNPVVLAFFILVIVLFFPSAFIKEANGAVCLLYHSSYPNYKLEYGKRVGDVQWTERGYYIIFEKATGTCHMDAEIEPITVTGEINKKYAALNYAKGFLGFPMAPEKPTSDNGRFINFQGGSIYWHPSSGAYEVHGLIAKKWKELGAEKSFLKYPVTDETPTADGVGRYNHFQGGSIYWHPNIGTYEVHGLIKEKWKQLGFEKSFLGLPTSDETTVADGKGRYSKFQGGVIFWHPNIGTFEVHGLIYEKYKEIGMEKSKLGYPKTDELDTAVAGGKYNNFQNGVICWSPVDGVKVVEGGVGPNDCIPKIDSLPQLPVPTPTKPSSDTVEPLIIVPKDIVVKTSDSGGMTVEYSVSSVDNVDGVLVPKCTPSSGSKFPVGKTTVNCTASDKSGNFASKSFLVTVESGLSLPSWIKDVAAFWCKDKIDDDGFIEAIQYLIKNKVIIVPDVKSAGVASSDSVPAWIKNNACWWSEGKVSDQEFANALKYLIEQGIIKIKS